MNNRESTIQNLQKLKKHWEKRRNEVTLNTELLGGLDLIPLNEIEIGKTNSCGTDCSILGLAPEVFKVTDEHLYNGIFYYTLFSRSYFSYLHEEDTKINNPIWDYLFYNYPNDCLDKALQRLQNVIDGKINDEYTNLDFLLLLYYGID